MIKVNEYIKTAFSIEDANILNPIIEKEILNNDIIILDFTGIRFFTTLFFNNAISKYIIKLGPDEVNRRFHLIGLSEIGHDAYQISYDNACDYKKFHNSEGEYYNE